MEGSVCFTGNEAPTSRTLISEFIRPLQISGDKPELLSVKPTFLTRNRAGSPARAFLSEVTNSVCLHPTRIWLYSNFSFFTNLWTQKQMSLRLLHKVCVQIFCLELELWWRRSLTNFHSFSQFRRIKL